jgi:dCMP deaminase
MYSLREKQIIRMYLRIAAEVSTLSRCNRARVGALIVKEGNIISFGYNGTPGGLQNDCEDCSGNTYKHVIHAEANAILKAGVNCKGADLFMTLSPCTECCKLIKQSGIRKVYYSNVYRETWGLDKLEIDHKFIPDGRE